MPLVVRALRDPSSGVDTIVLHDTDPGRVRTVSAVLAETAVESGGPAILVEDDLGGALRGADFVFSAIRVGGLRGRTSDERSALAQGVLGQETIGAGGVCYGLRTVPVAVRIADAVRRVAPQAWVINFTNPAGMVTEAMSQVLGDRVIGICDSPVGLFRRVARALGVEVGAAWFDYAGLNHLGWLRRVLVDGRDVLPALLADDAALGSFEEGRLFGADLLRTLGAIPNEYVYYYVHTDDAIRSITDAPATRGEFLLAQQQAFYAAGDAPGAAQRWERTRLERETTYMAESREASGAGERDTRDLDGGGYDQVAIAVMRAIAADERASLVLNVRNRGAVPDLDADAVVEVPCLVGRNGAHPLATGGWAGSPGGMVPGAAHSAGGGMVPGAAELVSAVKATERATISAARSGSRRAAVAALAMHPLVGSREVAERILARELDELPELRSVLTAD